MFMNCAEALRDGVDLLGVTPPTPCKEFIEALRCKDGVGDRVSMLIELGLRSSGLRGGPFPLPFDEEDRARCIFGLEGEDTVGEDGKAVEAAVLSDSLLKDCARPLVLFVDCKGDALATPLGDEEAMVNPSCDKLLKIDHSCNTSLLCLLSVEDGCDKSYDDGEIIVPTRASLLYANPCSFEAKTFCSIETPPLLTSRHLALKH